ncbi:exonuclease domain-containing protein [Rhodobacteraceae bacterium D3-12]|nr:exonuclease domain-containing protein [Rhodobacteraceae bacterium D3-12]
MLTKLGLRLRVFLFFVFIAATGVAIIAGALLLGYRRMVVGEEASAFVFVGILATFGFVAVAVGVWLLFDENVAKPIERLAANMRTRAHADVDVTVDTHQARYLGDLGPAAQAVSGQLSHSTMNAAAKVAAETARLAAEKDRLTTLLTEIPVAMIVVSPTHQIVLYDGQAAAVLGQIHAPRLNASVFEYFRQDTLLEAYEKLQQAQRDVSFEVCGVEGSLRFDARLKPLGQAPGYMIVIDDAHAMIAPNEARPLTYDFDLLEHDSEKAIEDRPIEGLNYVVFDTETTGLLPNKDEIVQIGAVRVVNGKIVSGELMDQLVNPGMKIPSSSIKVHRVTDDMVIDAPDIQTAGRAFHSFARGAVIVAHNAPFDMAFLRRHAKVSGLVWDHPILDTVLLSAILFGASEEHTLDALCDRLGVSIPPLMRHTALGDAQATAEVLCKMLPMLRSRGFASFGQVIEQTRRHGRLLQDLN